MKNDETTSYNSDFNESRNDARTGFPARRISSILYWIGFILFVIGDVLSFPPQIHNNLAIAGVLLCCVSIFFAVIGFLKKRRLLSYYAK